MYTMRERPRKNLARPNEAPTLLGNAVAAAVNGRTEDLLQLTIEYYRWDGTKGIAELAELLLRTLGEIHIQGEPTDKQDEKIDRAAKELQKSHRQFRDAMTWLCSSKESGTTMSPSLKLLASGRLRWGRDRLVDKKSENFIRAFECHG